MRRSPEETAVLVALLLLRSGQKRARVSEKTVKRLARRKRLRTAFLAMIRQHLEDRAIVMIELDDGSWGLMPSKGLEGAPTITAKKYLIDDLERLKRDKHGIAWQEFRQELEDQNGVDDDEE